MRLQIVTGYWSYHAFSRLGKLTQCWESWSCDGRSPGHLALRFIPDNAQDSGVFNRMDPTVFGKTIYYKSNCDSVLFDITRTRVPKFHLVKDDPWSHETLTGVVVYDIETTQKNVDAVLHICRLYASGERPYVYDDWSYANGFFPICFQCCPIVLRQGHCVQLILQILSEALRDDAYRLRYELKYEDMCTGLCTRSPPYAAYSPRKAIEALQALDLIQYGEPLYEEQCLKFAFKPGSLKMIR